MLELNVTVQSPTILVADDHPTERKLISLISDQLGVSAVLAENGKQALDIWQSQKIDLILMDWQMPILDGCECTRLIRSREEGTGIRVPIIAFTACAMPGDQENCRDAGMDDYIAKPFSLSDLETVLKRWLPG